MKNVNGRMISNEKLKEQSKFQDKFEYLNEPIYYFSQMFNALIIIQIYQNTLNIAFTLICYLIIILISKIFRGLIND